ARVTTELLDQRGHDESDRDQLHEPAETLHGIILPRRLADAGVRLAAYAGLMGRLVVTEFMTLDGVMEAPGFEEHRDGKNTWALSTTTEDQQRFKVDEIFAAGAILLGRVTYQIWATFWPDAPKDAGLADRINALEKYVVSTT